MTQRHLYITYNRTEFGSGRSEHTAPNGDRWTIHSTDFRPKMVGMPWDFDWEASRDNHRRAEQSLEQAFGAASGEIDEADVVYVYVGVNAAEPAQDMIVKLLQLGKKVVMTCCDCGLSDKQAFARKHGIEMVVSEYCGGTYIPGQIMAKQTA